MININVYNLSDSRLRDRGFACFLLDISPHLAPHLNVDGRINSGSSPACHRARIALTSGNLNFVRSVRAEFLFHVQRSTSRGRDRPRNPHEGDDFESRALPFEIRRIEDRLEVVRGIPRGPGAARGRRT